MARCFVIGGSGYIGSAIVRALKAAGRDVAALSRSPASDEILARLGAVPVRGDLSGTDCLSKAARESDGVIYAARYAPEELSVLRLIADALEGSGKPFVFTSGASVGAEETAGHAGSRRYAEDTPIANPPKPSAIRLQSENAVRSAKGVRGMAVRPPLVYGLGGSVQIPLLARSAETGAVRYIGPGENVWAFVHVEDLAGLYIKALERGEAGATYHAVAGEIAFRTLAEAVGEALGKPAASWTLEEAEQFYGKFAARVTLGSDCRPTCALTQAALAWRPHFTDIVEDVTEGSYRAAWRG